MGNPSPLRASAPGAQRVPGSRPRDLGGPRSGSATWYHELAVALAEELHVCPHAVKQPRHRRNPCVREARKAQRTHVAQRIARRGLRLGVVAGVAGLCTRYHAMFAALSLLATNWAT